MPSPKKPAKKPAAKKAPSTKTKKAVAQSELAPPPPTKPKAYAPTAGAKVFVRGRAAAGFAEVASVADGKAKLRFFRDAVNTTEIEVPTSEVAHGVLPN